MMSIVVRIGTLVVTMGCMTTAVTAGITGDMLTAIYLLLWALVGLEVLQTWEW